MGEKTEQGCGLAFFPGLERNMGAKEDVSMAGFFEMLFFRLRLRRSHGLQVFKSQSVQLKGPGGLVASQPQPVYLSQVDGQGMMLRLGVPPKILF